MPAIPRILVIDDDPSYGQMVFRLLKGNGYEAAHATTAKDGLAQIRSRLPDLILVDIHLPDLNGVQLRRALRQDPRTQSIPVILMTGKSAPCGLRGAAIDGIDASSVYRKGSLDMEDLLTRVRGALPVRKRGAAERAVQPPASDRSIFVIDDDPEVQELVRFSLEPRYPRLHFFASGEKGFQQALERPPHLVLLDLAMPGMNGAEAYGLFRGNEKTKGIPVMVMTAMPDDANVLKTLLAKLGTDDFLPKPFGANELIQRVGRVLREAARSPARPEAPRTLERGCIKVDTATRRVWMNGQSIRSRLAPTRFKLLCALLRHPGPVSREELRSEVWGDAAAANIVEMNVSRLRDDLGLAASEVLVSVPGGYHLIG